MDLTGDGVDDIVAGSYLGMITMYEGIKGGGFKPSVVIEQAIDVTDRNEFHKVMFSDATFADLNGDGLQDIFIGGQAGVRVMYNVGTAITPKYGDRIPLLRTDGKQVSVFLEHEVGVEAPDYKGYVHCIDWNNDGTLDLVTASSYEFGGSAALLFHKGVMTSEGIRFEPGVDIIKQENGIKALPGTYIMPSFGDFNDDGVMDMFIGTKMKFNIKSETINQEEEYAFGFGAADFYSYYYGKVAREKYNNDPEKLKKRLAEITEEAKQIEKADKSPRMQPNYSRDLKTRGYLMYFEGKKK